MPRKSKANTRSQASYRRLPQGADVLPDGGVHFRVWASRCKKVEVVIENKQASGPGRLPLAVELKPEANGYYSAVVAEAATGALYRYRLDSSDDLYPDPASRFQPEGPHGPSQVIDPTRFKWTDGKWPGARIEGQVIYEMHIGTFTREGTWEAAARELDELSRLGITVIEVMPVHEFPGLFGWGYDGVDMFAPTRLYGEPDDFRRFVDGAHASGIAVILDVVYNHLGPDGNYLKQFSEDYFSKEYDTDWGEAINFDGENSAPVREFFTSNASYWITEFHLDGLRLDATQNIYDKSDDHILRALTRRAREAAGKKSILIVGENEPQNVRLIKKPEEGGYGLDSLWNDDFHHTAMVFLTGRREAYYTDYTGTPQEFVSAAKWGFLYQGQRYKWQKQRRGTPTFGLNPAAFINFIQNHDQVANSARGDRVHRLTGPGLYRAMTALMLLMPGTPMLFQGQEFAASSPFQYFADHAPELARLVTRGRLKFLSQFRSLALEEMHAGIDEMAPSDKETFNRSKLDLAERESHKEIYEMHRDLIGLRRGDVVFSAQKRGALEGAVLGAEAFVLRFFGEGGDDRLLVVNLGEDMRFDPAPEPLLAPPEDRRWRNLWSSEDPRYGGLGTPPLDTKKNWQIPGRSAVALTAIEMEEEENE